MALARWEPFAESLLMRNWMDQLFDRNFGPGSLTGTGTTGLGFPLDVFDRGNEIVVKASLPGIRPDDVEITVTGDTLTIRGQMRTEEEGGQGNYLVQERRYGTFSRTLVLPTSVSADNAKAHFEDGVLTLTLPKSEEARPKQIKVQPHHTVAAPRQ